MEFAIQGSFAWMKFTMSSYRNDVNSDIETSFTWTDSSVGLITNWINPLYGCNTQGAKGSMKQEPCLFPDMFLERYFSNVNKG